MTRGFVLMMTRGVFFDDDTWFCFVDCEYNAHRQCVDKVRDTCSGSKSKKHKRQSVLEKIIRKPSSNNPAASTYTPFYTSWRDIV